VALSVCEHATAVRSATGRNLELFELLFHPQLTDTRSHNRGHPAHSGQETMAKIIHLPLDVRVEIISFLAAKKDLVAICNSCKAFYDAAIPRLYRRMTVTEDVDTEMLNAALGPENAGTQHVRHLEVVSSDGNEHSQKSSLDNVLSLLANLLPRDVLLTFL